MAWTFNPFTGKLDYFGMKGPASSTDNAFVRFDGATGKIVKNSQTTEDASGNVTVVGNLTTGNFVTLGDAVYLGEKATNGSFRIQKDGTTLKFQYRTGGTYVDVGEMSYTA